jgi:hypothetical protein
MGFYAKYILPRASHFLCSTKPVGHQRKKIVPLAQGRVLEVGIGSGLNLPLYDAGKVQHLWGLDPSKQSWPLAKQAGFKIRSMDTMYIPGWKPACFNYWGTAISS